MLQIAVSLPWQWAGRARTRCEMQMPVRNPRARRVAGCPACPGRSGAAQSPPTKRATSSHIAPRWVKPCRAR